MNAPKDPRNSIAERYGRRAEYVRRVREAATTLADQRFILRDDVQPITDQLGAQWDAIMGAASGGTRTNSR